MSKRFLVSFTQDEFRGHRGVKWTLYRFPSKAEFRNKLASIEMPTLVGLERELELQEYFSFSEADIPALQAWFLHSLGVQLQLREQVANPRMALKRDRRLIGGSGGVVSFGVRTDWPFLFGANGYYDLRCADSGPFVDNPDLE